MNPGKALEMFVKEILLLVGFNEVLSDGFYVFEGVSGLMLQGLGEVHNADVLLEPPVQTPFYSMTRLVVECKDHKKKVGLNTVRSALGLRQDINSFEIVDAEKLLSRRSNRRKKNYELNARYSYQVALVSGNGYSVQAQNFAATHRIPLIEFTRMPFWTELEQLLHNEATTEEDICKFAHEVGRKLALAVTNSGQLLYLYRVSEMGLDFEHSEYTLHWKSEDSLWELSNRHTTGDICYLFQLPEQLAERMKSHAATFRELQRDAIDMKAEYFSQMAVYYRENGHARIGNIRINKQWLEEAKAKLR